MQQYFLGCDVSKGYTDFIVLDAQKRVVEQNFQLDDTFDGHAELYRFLEQFFDQHPDATINAAVESTGGYENNWFQDFVATLMPQLRGKLNAQVRKIGHYNASAEVIQFVNSKKARELAALGTSCPDHFLRTKILSA